MSARVRQIDRDALLATIREHGPITKTELQTQFLGYRAGCKALIVALHDLQRSGVVAYRVGENKARGHTHWVYTAVPQ